MADIRLKTVTVDSGPLFIKSGSVTILDTSESTSTIFGSLICNGGISINSTYNSTSFTSGGTLTVGGGMGVSKNVFLGQNLKLENSTSVFEISGLSTPRLFFDTVINKQLSISPDGVNTRFVLDNNKLILSSTQLSINSSSASLVVGGGISISSTQNSNSPTEGGSLTIAGGVGIAKNLNVANNVAVGSNNSQVVIGSTLDPDKTGVFLTYSTNLDSGILSSQTNKNLLLSPFSGNVGIGTTSPIYLLDVNGTINASNFTGSNMYISQDIVTNNISAASAIFTSATFPSLFSNSMTMGNLGGTNVSTENLSTTNIVNINFSSSNSRITNSTITNIVNTNTSISSLAVTNSRHSNITSTNLLITNITCGGRINVVNSLVTNLTSTNSVFTNITSTNYIGTSITCGTILTTNANITNNTIQNLFNTNLTSNSILVTGLLNVSGGIVSTDNSNTIGSLFTTLGNIGIGTTSPQKRLHIIDDFRLSSESGLSFSDFTIDNNNLIIGGKNAGNLILKSNGNSNDEGVFINKSNNNTILCCLESSNVGIGTTTPSYRLDVAGNFRATSGDVTFGTASITNSQHTNITCNSALFNTSLSSTGISTIGNIFTTGGNVGIATTSPSYTLDINGTIRVNNNINIIGSLVTNTNTLSIGTGVTANPSFRLGMPVGSAIGTSGPDRVFINFTGFDFDIGSSVANGGTGSIAYFSRNGRIVTLSGTQESSNLGSGTLIVNGGSSISKNLNLGGNMTIHSTTDSINVSTGALIVNGGVGISKNLNVLGNTVITGDLIVNGTTTSIETTNTTLKDNIFVLNSGPSGSRDSGFVINRYQIENNSGLGDVVNDIYPVNFVIGDQTGVNSTQIKLPSSASSSNDFYKNWWIKITSGFSSNQVRKIISYNGTTKIATLSSSWSTQNPANNDNISLYNKPYVGMFYNEINDVFVFGSIIDEPGQNNVEFSNYLPIQFSKATNVSTENSTNLSSGSLIMNGGLTITSTEDSSSLTSGGTITTNGGVSIGKTLRTKDLWVNNVQFIPNSSDILTTKSFIANNNQNSFANIIDLSFDSGTSGVDIYLTAKITATPNLAANFHIRGVYNGSSWTIVKTYVGDDTGIEFNMTNVGQLQYTTPNYNNVTQILFKFKAFIN